MADLTRVEHDVTISAKSCETTRECYCLATNGEDHDERDSVWIVNRQGGYERGKGTEPAPNPPYLPGESWEDYLERTGQEPPEFS